MDISKNTYFNKYFENCLFIFYLLILSLIPWLEFINENLKEVDFILNKSFSFILTIYLSLIIFIFFLIKIMTDFQKSHIICIVSFSIWILFQHNFFKEELGLLLFNVKLDNLSSEFALFFIVIFILLGFYFIPKKKFLKVFVFIFLTFNLFYSGYIFSTNFFKKKSFEITNNINNSENNEVFEKLYKKPNIYFLILDGMMPLNNFENFYNIDLQNFKEKFNEKNYIYFKDVKNLYGDTTYGLTALFYLESIFIEDDNFDEKTNLKSHIKKKFPSILKKNNNSKLINSLNDLGYEFKWIGNIFADCSRYNYNYCLQNKEKIKLDYYLLSAFLKKTPIPQIYNIIVSPDFIQKNMGIYEKNNAISKLQKYLLDNNDYVKKTSKFYFVHHMHPHWPYKFDENCNFKNFPGNLNFDGYKNSYLCVTKQITDLINTIEIVDDEAIVIFQSDHNWEMSKLSDEKYGSRINIFSLIKDNIQCNKPLPIGLNNLGITKYILNCLNYNKNNL